MKLSRLTLALAGIGFCTMATTAFAQEVKAQEESKKNENAPVQRVEITGSNIKRVNIETASPVQVISKEELVRGGATSLNDVLRNVSANIGGIDENRTNGFTAGAAGLNLRGIGSQATLVLINGRRMVPFNLNGTVDTNSIPIALLSRVDLLESSRSVILDEVDAVAVNPS